MPARMILLGGPYDGEDLPAVGAETLEIDLGRGPAKYKRTRMPDSEGREIMAHRPTYYAHFDPTRRWSGGPHGPAVT